MTRDDDLLKISKLVEDLNERLDRTVTAMVAFGEIVRVTNEQQEWRDDRIFQALQQIQADSKKHHEELKEIVQAGDALLIIISDELSELAPAMAHAAEQITQAARQFKSAIGPKTVNVS